MPKCLKSLARIILFMLCHVLPDAVLTPPVGLQHTAGVLMHVRLCAVSTEWEASECHMLHCSALHCLNAEIYFNGLIWVKLVHVALCASKLTMHQHSKA